ncbi:hypothetical protein SNL152K_761 [Streptomyces sp. NL15-2K]|nr:hypothetical protein SNL152K_761 [Streptomyces sp. NL15-2K]
MGGSEAIRDGTGCGSGPRGHGGQAAAPDITDMRTLSPANLEHFAGRFVAPDTADGLHSNVGRSARSPRSRRGVPVVANG